MFAPIRRLTAPLARAALVASALFVAACDPAAMSQPQGPVTGQMIEPGQPVQVALLVPGNTGNAELDRIGRSLANAARMAAADAQGAQIDLRVYPHAPTEAATVARANEAANAGAKIIVGPLFGDSSNAVGLAMRERNINVLSFSNNADIAGHNVFVLGNTFSNVANRLVSYGVRQGKRRFLTVYENDPAGQVGAGAIAGAIAQQGATQSGQIPHALSQEGIDRAIPQITNAVQGGQIDAIFVTANQQAVLPYLTDRLYAAGVTSADAQFMGLTRWDRPAARLQLPGVQGAWFAIPDTRLTAQFENRYRQAYGEAPHELGALGYDGISAIAALAATRRANALTSTGLTRAQGFSGVNGVFRFLPDGTNQRGMAIATINGGQVQVIDPAPQRFGGAGF
ncbi:MAG: penicillin-binding protein activator [Paracoccus sp. (in: a-proteobacteria)]|nr:penicillin-binding protein activator [Paracoccus sp. (in: a-proteobacteria)]